MGRRHLSFAKGSAQIKGILSDDGTTQFDGKSEEKLQYVGDGEGEDVQISRTLHGLRPSNEAACEGIAQEAQSEDRRVDDDSCQSGLE